MKYLREIGGILFCVRKARAPHSRRSAGLSVREAGSASFDLVCRPWIDFRDRVLELDVFVPERLGELIEHELAVDLPSAFAFVDAKHVELFEPYLEPLVDVEVTCDAGDSFGQA